MGTRSLDDVSPREWDMAAKKIAANAEQEAKEYQPIKPYKLPSDALARKNIPVYSGFFKYFPRAIAEVARISLVGGIQHGQTRETLHWDRPKSGDELDALLRHLMDGDYGQVAWRALAHLEKHLEREEGEQV